MPPFARLRKLVSSCRSDSSKLDTSQAVGLNTADSNVSGLDAHVHEGELYPTLDPTKNQVRLATIQPGTFSAPIQCKLSVVSLDDGAIGESLSYVWGDPTITLPISLEGREFQITKNLETALRHLRYENRPRVIWVDALCVDQHNTDERNHQVALMHRIYKSALVVIAWLGEETDGSSVAFDTLEEIARDPRLHLLPPKEPCLRQEYMDQDHMSALLMLMRNDWWQRVWTVQEAVLPVNLVLVLGKHTIQGKTLSSASTNFSRHWRTCCLEAVMKRTDRPWARFLGEGGLRQISVLDLFRRQALADDLDFPLALSSYRNQKCLDARDRVYGFLGLACGIYEGFLFPDYELSLEQILEATSVAIIERTQNIDIFTFIYTPLGGNRNGKLPSWAVDWTASMSPKFYKHFNSRVIKSSRFSAGGRGPAIFTFPEPGIITVKGCLVDCINAVGQCANSYNPAKAIPVYDEWRHLAEAVQTSPYRQSSPGGGMASAFHLTLINDIIFDPDSLGTVKNIYYGRVRGRDRMPWFEKWWKALHEEGTAEEDQEALHFDHATVDATHGRRFFTSAKGYMGLGPAAIAPDDVIAILYGGDVAYVLRKTDRVMEMDGSAHSCYEMLGPAYLHGMMDGQAFNALKRGELQEQTIILI